MVTSSAVFRLILAAASAFCMLSPSWVGEAYFQMHVTVNSNIKLRLCPTGQSEQFIVKRYSRFGER